MISNVKFNELANKVVVMEGRIAELEIIVRSLSDRDGGNIPAGMTPLTTLAAEFGISTKKGEELAKNSGVLLVKQKSGGYIVPDEKFREAARLVLRSAKRKIGSAYWYHPLLGKFQMSGGLPK